jgi:hypothetical protein
MDLISYIKQNYPNIIVNSIDLSEYKDKNAIGFVITDSQLIIGYINKKGQLKKILEPIDVSKFDLSEIKEKIPRVFSGSIDNLEKIITNTNGGLKKIDDKIMGETTIPIVLYNDLTKEYLLIKQQYEKDLQQLISQEKVLKDNQKKCIDSIVSEKDVIIEHIQEFIKQIKTLFLKKDRTIKESRELYEQVTRERDTLLQRLSVLDTVTKDTKAINEIKKELENVTNELYESKFREEFLEKSYAQCKIKISDEKTEIIKGIRMYKDAIREYIKKIREDDITLFDSTKEKMLNEYRVVNETLQELSKNNNNCNEIQLTLNESIAKGILQLNKKEDEILEYRKNNSELTIKNKEQNIVIMQLNKELSEIKALMSLNNSEKIIPKVDYNRCQNTLYTLIKLNNIFKRKIEIISLIEKVMSNPSAKITEEIIANFQDVKGIIYKYIDFLDLDKYINSIYVEYFKNETSMKKIPESFCEELDNLIVYWNENTTIFREQDTRLTNIYEDISNAVRIYVRIKPIFTEEIKSCLKINQGDNTIDIKCNNTKTTLGPYYSIFNETETNLDIYTGNADTVQTTDFKITIPETDENNRGMYNIFNQLQSGYNLLLFAYGSSGSGKSSTLLGERGMNGLIHYGLGNLENIKYMRLRNLFEQSNNLVNINFNKMTGRIHNLVGEIKALRQFSKNETKQFRESLAVDSQIDFNDIKVSELNDLIIQIDNYRREARRIKKTPNNNNSSRSHLYFVFEIVFNNGVIGHLTIVDTAGRESPTDIYNTFLETTKVSLESILAPTGGLSLINNYMKPEYQGVYFAEDILNILKEGFYINETINHLIYYFNFKNDLVTNVVMQSSNLKKYNTIRYYINPKTELTAINDSNNCLTIPILEFLNNLNQDQNKPTKYIMICNVRQEPGYCDQTQKTLEFAESIKSN